MSFMNWIIQRLQDASDFFYNIYLEVLSWVYPFWLAASFFYQLCLIFNKLAWDFTDFRDWVDDVIDQLGDILSWSTIRSYIRNWLPDLEDVVDWWDRWWVFVGQEIDDWWDVVWGAVKNWVYARIDDVKELINSAETWLANLQAAWDEWKVKIPSFNELWLWFTNWWGSTLTNIIAWGALTATQIDSLISSRLKEWFPFFDSIVEFFTDPLEWLWDRFLSWALGSEEE